MNSTSETPLNLTTPGPAPGADHVRWFTDEVQPHESSLRSYLRGAFPSAGELDDIVQESYLRILRRKPTQPIRSARALLFTVARHIAVDLLRRNRVSPVEPVSRLTSLSVLQEGPDAAEAADRQERIDALAAAIAELPTRCREVFILHKIREYSRKEVAARLGLAEKTVEVQTARAVRRCAAYLHRRGMNGLFDHGAR